MDAVKTETSVKNAPSLTEDRFELADQKRAVWSVIVPNNVTFEDLERPEYWAHVAHRMHDRFGNAAIGSILEVTPDDMRFFARYLIRGVSRMAVKLGRMERFEFGTAEEYKASEDDDGFKVEWSGRHTLWRVKLGTDVLKDKIQNKEAATMWLASYKKAQAA